MKGRVLPVFLGVRTVDEVHLQRDRGHIAASGDGVRDRLAHLLVALSLALLIVALGDFLCAGHLQMQPLRCRIIPEQGAVNEALRQIQHVAVLVLAGGHDTRGHIRQIDIIGDRERMSCSSRMFMLLTLRLTVLVWL